MGDHHLMDAIRRMSDMTFHLPMNQGYAWSYHGRGLRPSIPERPRLHIWEQGPEEKIKRHIFQRMEDEKELNALREYKNQIHGCEDAKGCIIRGIGKTEQELLMENAYLYRYRVEKSDLFQYAKPPGDIMPTSGDAWEASLRDYGQPVDPLAFAIEPPKRTLEVSEQIGYPNKGEVKYDFFCGCTKHPPHEERSKWKPGDFYFETLERELPKKLPFKPDFPGFEVVGQSNWPPKPSPEKVIQPPPKKEEEEIRSFKGPAAKIDCTWALLPGHVGVVATSKIKLKNTGTTALYFTWEHVPMRPYIIKDPQPNPNRVFHVMCGSGSIVPDESKEFLFSFKSKVAGIFLEKWDVIFDPKLIEPLQPLVVKGLAFLDEEPTRVPREKLVALLEQREMHRGVEEVNEYLWLTSVAMAKPIPKVGEFLLNPMESKNFIRKNQFFKLPLYFSEALYKELLHLYKLVRIELFEEGLCTKILDTIFLSPGPHIKPQAYKGPSIEIPVHESLLDDTFPLQSLPNAVPFDPYPKTNPIQTPSVIPDDGGPVRPLTPLKKPRPKPSTDIPLVVKSEETRTLWFTANLVPPCGYGVASLRPAAAAAPGPVSLRNRGFAINTSLYPSPNAVLFPDHAWIDEVSPYYAIQVEKPRFVPIPKDPTIPHNIPPHRPHIFPPPPPPNPVPFTIPPGTEKNPFWQNFWFPPLLAPPCGFGVPDLILNRTESMDPKYPSVVDSFAKIPNLVYTTVWDGSSLTILQGIAAIQNDKKRNEFRNIIATLLDAAAVPPSRFALLYVAMYKVVYDVMGAFSEVFQSVMDDPRKTLEECELRFQYISEEVEEKPTQDHEEPVEVVNDKKSKKKVGKNPPSKEDKKPKSRLKTQSEAKEIDSKPLKTNPSKLDVPKSKAKDEVVDTIDDNKKNPKTKGDISKDKPQKNVDKKSQGKKEVDVEVKPEEPEPKLEAQDEVVQEDPAKETRKFLFDMMDASIPKSVEIEEVKKLIGMGIDQYEEQIKIGYAAALLVIDERIKVLKRQPNQDETICWSIFQLETKRDDLLEEERELLGCNELDCKYCFE